MSDKRLLFHGSHEAEYIMMVIKRSYFIDDTPLGETQYLLLAKQYQVIQYFKNYLSISEYYISRKIVPRTARR